MRASWRQPPSILERLLGRRRARVIRRRVGILALGAGVSLLRPRPRTPRVSLVLMTSAGAVALLVFGHGHLV